MATLVHKIEKGIKHAQSLTLGTRLLLFVLIWCVQSFYIPTSNRVAGGIQPKLPIDIFPIWSVWVLPYVLSYTMWAGGILWAIFKMENRLFRAMIAAFLLTCTVSMSIYIFFPTYVKAATFHGNDVFTSLLRFIHKNGGRYDAFPSGHIYITVLMALFYNRWYPEQRAWWIAIPLIVTLSTLFTGQHYIADIIGGVIVALLGYYFGLRWAGISAAQHIRGQRHLLGPRS